MSEPNPKTRNSRERVNEYLRAVREDIIAAAEMKVGRSLSSDEENAINGLSAMRLEPFYRSCTELADYSGEQASLDLAGLVQLVQGKQGTDTP